MTTPLQLGNLALREGRFAEAVPQYLRALEGAPVLHPFVSANLAMARRGWLAQRPGRQPIRVAVCTAADLAASPRVQVLLAAHDRCGTAAMLSWSLSASSPAAAAKRAPRKHIAVETSVERFAALALQRVGEQPLDLLHIAQPSGPAALLALLYKLLWGTRVLVDLETTPGQAPGAAAAALPAPGALAGPQGDAWAATVLHQLDGSTVAKDHKNRPAGALVVGDGDPPPALQAGPSRPLPAAVLAAWPSLGLPPWAGKGIAALAQSDDGINVAALQQALQQAQATAAPIDPPRSTAAAPVVAAPPPAPPVAPEPAVQSWRPRQKAVPDATALPDWLRSEELLGRRDAGAVQLFGRTLALARAPAGSDAGPLPGVLAWLSGHGEAPALPQSVCRWELAAAGARIVDIWFTSDSMLRLRVEMADSAPPHVLRAYQVGADPVVPVSVGERPLVGAGPHFIDLELARPWMPVLLAFTDTRGHWLDGTLLPVPQLCRGGLLHAELAACGEWSESMASLAALGHQACEALRGDAAGGGRALSVARVEVELTGATGAERIFSSPVREWLAVVAAVDVVPQPAASSGASSGPDAGLFDAFVTTPGADTGAAAARRQQRAASGHCVLTLAADSLPTLAALTSRQLGDGSEAVRAGPWIVASASNGRPRALVRMPPMDATLLELQPAALPLQMPCLRPVAPAGDAAGTGEVTVPLAIRLVDAFSESAATRLTPLSPDAPGPLLRGQPSTAARREERITLLLRWAPGAPDPAPLLASLASQTVAGWLDAVVVLPAGSGSSAEAAGLKGLLERHFPKRHRTVHADGSGPALLNRAAQEAQGSLLLLADPGVLLHDKRTLEVLATLLAAPRVATAACTLLREVALKKSHEVRRVSGGMFPRQLSFHTRPTLLVDEPVSTAALPAATYPVLGNALRLSLVSAQAWRALDGLDALRQADDGRAALDFSLRALRGGWRHLCTGAVSASLLQGAVTTEFKDSHGLAFMPLQRWQEVLDSVTTVRDFEA